MIDALQANHGKLFSYPVDVCGNQRWTISCSMNVGDPLTLFDLIQHTSTPLRLEITLSHWR